MGSNGSPLCLSFLICKIGRPTLSLGSSIGVYKMQLFGAQCRAGDQSLY